MEFYFDPMCPYAYHTSLWMREVRALTGVEIRWRFFSLEEINRAEGKKHPWERDWSFGWSQMRVGAWLRRKGMDHLDRWYLTVGQAFFDEGVETQFRENHQALLDRAGFGAEAVPEALADPTTADEVRADHDHAVASFGAFGVPTLAFPDGSAVFGPIVVPAPEGPKAVDLWEYVQRFSEFPTLYELKRPKRGEDLARIGTLFEPYLRARTWRTIENPAP